MTFERDVNRASGFQRAGCVRHTDPNFDGGAPRVERRTNERDLGIKVFVYTGNRDGGAGSYAEPLCLRLSDVQFGDHGGGIHDRDNRRASGSSLAGKERTIGHHARYWRSNVGVAELRLCCKIFAFSRGELSLRRLERSTGAG